jgi:hypothetical protein
MTKSEVRQQIKLTALNQIRKIYNPKYRFPYQTVGDYESFAEQREWKIKYIIEGMEKELAELEEKFSK